MQPKLMWRCSLAVNQNGFNSRVTSEALEERFRQVFPAQAGAELIQDLYASGVIVPVIDFTTVAEGTFLPESLQQAWDFSTGSAQINNATTTLISNTGFWQVDLTCTLDPSNVPPVNAARLEIFDGSTAKRIWSTSFFNASTNAGAAVASIKFVVFLRSGDSVRGISASAQATLDVWYRQIADVSGNLVNPLGFTF